MIKAEKQGQEIRIEIKGAEPVIIIECARILEQIKNLLSRSHNEEFARKMMDDLYQTIWMTKEEIDEECKKVLRDVPFRFFVAQAIRENLFGGAKVALAA